MGCNLEIIDSRAIIGLQGDNSPSYEAVEKPNGPSK